MAKIEARHRKLAEAWADENSAEVQEQIDAYAQGFADGEGELRRIEAALHARFMHPDFEYETTTGPRKAWDDQDVPPVGPGWELNADAGTDGWERFDYHEESYWRRRRMRQGDDHGED